MKNIAKLDRIRKDASSSENNEEEMEFELELKEILLRNDQVWRQK